jgi:hypothetical protein
MIVFGELLTVVLAGGLRECDTFVSIVAVRGLNLVRRRSLRKARRSPVQRRSAGHGEASLAFFLRPLEAP